MCWADEGSPLWQSFLPAEHWLTARAPAFVRPMPRQPNEAVGTPEVEVRPPNLAGM
jgi:hypothetical protein